MASTSIEWCDHSVNPIRARDTRTGAVGHYCEKIATGCANCYASRLQQRFHMPSFGGRSESLPEHIEVFLDESKLDEVRRRKKPTRYFWEDMSDLFGWWVKPEWLAKCFEAIDATPQHTHILLTKRPENVRRMWSGNGIELPQINRLMNRDPLHRSNVWLLTSISTQADANRNVNYLLECRDLVPILGVSAEPLLGQVDLRFIRPINSNAPCSTDSLTGITYWPDSDQDEGPRLDWVICGGESGPNARPYNLQWARSLKDQCEAADVPFFHKQIGANVIGEVRQCCGVEWLNGSRDARCQYCGELAACGVMNFDPINAKGGNQNEWPIDLRVRQSPSLAN